MRAFLTLALSALLVFAAGSAWLAFYPAVPVDLAGAPDLDAHATHVKVPVDGESIDGWLLPGTRPGVVVLFSGYARDHHRMWRYAQFLRKEGWSILTVDFRSVRMKDRKPTTLGYWELRDARATLDWLRVQPRYAHARVALFGESLGGSVALELAAERHDVTAVVADCPFADGKSAIADGMEEVAHLPAWPLAALARWLGERVTGHDPGALDVIAAVKQRGDAPLMLIQSTAEDRFSKREVEALSAAAGPSAVRWTLTDCGHNAAWLAHRDEYETRVRAFLRPLLSPPATSAATAAKPVTRHKSLHAAGGHTR
jgi:pimeloyl-ACP methyl ester carboxylesterase